MRKLIKSFILQVCAIVFRDTRPKVVFYHDVGTKYTPMGTPSDLFWVHMSYFTNLQPPATNHQLCFDDGFRGIWDERERFRAMGIRPIVFIAIDLVGKPGYLTWDEIRTLQNEYGFDFQSHSWSHQTLIGPCNTDLPEPALSEESAPSLVDAESLRVRKRTDSPHSDAVRTPRLRGFASPSSSFRTDAWYEHELVDSKVELERQLGREVTALCFPVGYFSDDVITRCAAAGYTRLYASFPGNKEASDSIVPLHLFSPPLSLFPRCLCQDLSLGDFKAVLAGGMNPLGRRYFALHYCDDTDDLK